MSKNKSLKKPIFAEGLLARQICEKIPRLSHGNFTHWVKYKAGCLPIGKVIVKTGAADLFPLDTVERVRRVMGEG